jgi:ABC-type lipoprotein export system ATPase subunit
MEDCVFKIRNLEVSFGGEAVLYASSLDIPRGELIFLLGNSGSGKTTFMEVLGLMSTYAKRDSQVIFYPEAGNDGIDYEDLWGNEEQLAAFRRKYFAFMFQTTELFPQFTIPENVAIPQIIQNVEQHQALTNARNSLESLQIEHRSGHHITQISGGERQRVAFARSVLSEASVLFADEPTGNLGEEDSERVMEHIREFVRVGDSKSTAIVVTHNIDLALKYGDRIIVIQEDHCIKDTNVFVLRKNRQRDNTSNRDSLRACLHQKSNSLDRHRRPKVTDTLKAFSLPPLPDSSFRKFFGPRSTEDLSMKRKINWILLGILFLAFLAIGFAAGSLDVLKVKMEDPFVNWINIDVPFRKLLDVPLVLQAFGSDTSKKKYFIHSISDYERFPTNIYNMKGGGTLDAYGRTIDLSDPILATLQQAHLWIRGKLFYDSLDIGLIVTRDFLDFCGVGEDEGFIYLSMSTGVDRVIDAPVPIPVRAIVMALPGQSQFLSTRYFKNKRDIDSNSPFSPENARGLTIFCPGPLSNATRVLDSLNFFLKSIDSLRNPYLVVDSLASNQKPWNEGHVVKASFLPSLRWEWVHPLFDTFQARFRFPFETTLLYNYPNDQFYFDGGIERVNRVSIFVSKLDNVSTLRRDLLEKPFGFEIDLAKVEALNNYSVVTKLTSVLSIVIISISIISVCIYMGYVLYMHLFKNRIHLGILKAFGVPPKTLKRIYLSRMLASLSLSAFLAIVVAAIVGYSKLLRLGISWLGFPVESNYEYFDFANVYPLVFLLALNALSYVSLNLTANDILGRSPGDLIYDRIDSSSNRARKTRIPS